MQSGTFNVSEFNTIYAMLDDNSGKINNKSNEIIETCELLSQELKSTDSGLSSAYLRVGEALNMARGKVVNLLKDLEQEMRVYASKTIANEQEASTSLNKLNSDIEGIAAKLKAIAARSK